MGNAWHNHYVKQESRAVNRQRSLFMKPYQVLEIGYFRGVRHAGDWIGGYAVTEIQRLNGEVGRKNRQISDAKKDTDDLKKEVDKLKKQAEINAQQEKIAATIIQSQVKSV